MKDIKQNWLNLQLNLSRWICTSIIGMC